MKKQEYKNKWVAGVLNFAVWGLGYMYLGRGKREAFAGGLVIASLISIAGDLTMGGNLRIPLNYMIVAFVSWLIFSLVFAYDAYEDAKLINRERRIY